MSVTGDQNPPQLSRATTSAPTAQPPPLDQSEERKLRAGCDWWRGRGRLTSLHGGPVAVEHVVVCSDWRDLVPNLLNIASIRFGQVLYRPD